MWRFFVLGLAIIVAVNADANTADSIKGTVSAADSIKGTASLINKGKVHNNFYYAGILKAKAANVKEEVGACLGDKMKALISSKIDDKGRYTVRSFLFDLAACCTKSKKKKCMHHASPAYNIMYLQRNKGANVSGQAMAAAWLGKATKKFVDAKKLKSPLNKLVKACPTPRKCEYKKLKKIYDGGSVAANSISGMVSLITNGTFHNNFYADGILQGEAANLEEEVGACFADKIKALFGTVINSNRTVNDFLVDMAACCTKGKKEECMDDASPAYDIMYLQRTTKVENVPEQQALAAAWLAKATNKRVNAKRLNSPLDKLISLSLWALW